jgi:hypothetical protein
LNDGGFQFYLNTLWGQVVTRCCGIWRTFNSVLAIKLLWLMPVEIVPGRIIHCCGDCGLGAVLIAIHGSVEARSTLHWVQPFDRVPGNYFQPHSPRKVAAHLAPGISLRDPPTKAEMTAVIEELGFGNSVEWNAAGSD